MRATHVCGAVAVVLTAASGCGGQTPSAKVLPTTTSVTIAPVSTNAAPSTAAPPPTIVPVSTTGGANRPALLGSSVPGDETLYFESSDPAWRLSLFEAQYRDIPTGVQHGLLLVERGNDINRAVAAVHVGTQGILGQANASTATVGAVVEPVEVNGVETLGWSSTANGVPISGVQWPAPDGYVATILAIGLDLEEAAALAEHVEFEGLTPTLAPLDGYESLVQPAPRVRFHYARFVKGDVAVDVYCSDSGEAGLFAERIRSFARTKSRTIAGATVAERADDPPPDGPAQTELEEALWVVGGWWCEMGSSSPGGTVIADAELEALLGSLVLVDEATLRAESPGATIDIDPVAPEPAPVPSAATGAFSAGPAGVSSSWYAHFAPDGTRIVAVDPDGQGGSLVQFIDATTGALLHGFSTGAVPCPGGSISPDGQLLWDGASLRDTTTGAVTVAPVLYGNGIGINTVDFSRDGTKFVVSVSGDRLATVYSIPTGEELTTVSTSDFVLCGAAFTPDGNRLLLTGVVEAARIWDLTTDQQLLSIPLNDGYAGLSRDGRFVVVVNDAGARLVDSSTGETRMSVTRGNRGGFAFSADGSRLASINRAGPTSSLMLWDLDSLTQLGEIPFDEDPNRGLMRDDIFSPDGSHIVVVRGGVAEIYDVSTSALVSTLALDDGSVLSAAFSPDGTRIVTANSTGTVRVWPAP